MQHQQKLGNFITKLHYLLSRQEYSQIICWDNTKTVIDIRSEEKMEKEIIPHYFRHHKFESFVRQLNLYGFRKVKCTDRHRFTHSQLLKGDKLLNITSLKGTKHAKNEEKNEGVATSQEKSLGCIERGSSNDKLEASTFNSKQEEQGQLNNFSHLNERNIQNGALNINGQAQIFQSVPHPFFNYWNMLLMQQSNQFPGLMFVNPMMGLQ